MNRIILDLLRRRWWMWALFSLVSMAAGLILGIEREITISAVLYVSTSFVFMDWGWGGPRVLLSLPFNARQIGRAYWWTSVGVSTAIFAIFSGLGILILGLARAHGQFLGTSFNLFIGIEPEDTGSGNKFFGIWLEAVLAGGLLCGSSFWLMSGAMWAAALFNPGEPWWKRFPRQLFACAFIIAAAAVIYCLCRSTISITHKLVIAYLFGLIFSVLGWFRAQNLFIDSTFRPDVARAGVTRRKFEPRPGYGGVPYLLTRFCVFYLAVVALLIASVLGMGIAVWLNWDKWSDIVPPALLEFQFWLFFLCFFQTLIMGTHLKFLRSLPLTSQQLAAIILCLAIVPVPIIGGTWILFFLIKPGILPALSLVKLCLLNLAPVCVLTTGVIWYNDLFRRIAGVFVVWLVSIVPIFYQIVITNQYVGSHSLPVWIIIAIPVGSIFIALLAIRRLLERNETAYRMKFEIAPNWP